MNEFKRVLYATTVLIGLSATSRVFAACQNVVTAEFEGTVCTDPSQESRQGHSFLSDGGLLDTTIAGDTISGQFQTGNFSGLGTCA